MHHDAFMRTTVDINDALLKELRRIADEARRPFRAVLEETLQRGLAAGRGRTRRRKVSIEPHPLGLKPAIAAMSLNQVWDQIEAERDAESR